MRRRRKSSPAAPSPEPAPEVQAPVVEGPRAQGPWDAAEVAGEDQTRAHLGSLAVKPHPEVEFRLQVDEASEQVQAVMLVGADGAMELRAFAAPRNEDIWDDIRAKLADEVTRRGGTAAEIEGPYGPALQLTVSGVTPDGKQVTQPSTVLGIAGPRWLLRVSLFGRPATEYDPDGVLESALRDVVVHRGSQPMSPGEALPLTLPPGARRGDAPAQTRSVG